MSTAIGLAVGVPAAPGTASSDREGARRGPLVDVRRAPSDAVRRGPGLQATGRGPGLPHVAVGVLALARAGAGLVAVALGAEHLRHPDGLAWGAGLAAAGFAVGLHGLLDLRRRRAAGAGAA
ncbi:hypothetical protein, partial [Actinotalea ferrariae]|uniref:hypothetical protein n=1 Tax=Actinotalea ferrariae TaxID=1386098 RepID=UPI000558F051